MKKFEDILNLDFKVPQGFTLASRILDLRRKAENIAHTANNKQIENGEFATLFATNIKDWMQEIAELADTTLELHIENNTTKNTND